MSRTPRITWVRAWIILDNLKISNIYTFHNSVPKSLILTWHLLFQNHVTFQSFKIIDISVKIKVDFPFFFLKNVKFLWWSLGFVLIRLAIIFILLLSQIIIWNIIKVRDTLNLFTYETKICQLFLICITNLFLFFKFFSCW